VLIHHIQEDPVTDKAIHIDFLQVDLKEKVTAQVPIELLGESPAEKEGKGVVVQQIDEIEVEALPGDLPEKFEIDLSSLVNEDDSVYIKDIKVDAKKVSIKNEADQIIVKVEQAKKEEEAPVAPAVPEGEEPPSAEGEPVTGDKDKELGEKEKEVKDERKQTP
jgi:large subunit ribosomal protein L25